MGKKITVLGKTFNSEEERRTYFRNELRKQLTELKKMEGFPLGEDDDIINLSDPPYYTACPNPWLNNFIAEWEEEKKELEKQGKRKPNFEVNEPYASDVSEGKNNPIYNAHSYHTKVPHPAIMRYILHYTQPGDIVFDGFAGTGMTGVACQACENPNNELKYLISHENEFVKWGRRNSINSDLSPIASFITKVLNSSYDPNAPNRFQYAVDAADKEFGWMYKTKHLGNLADIDHVIWSQIFGCSSCGHEFVFWDEAVEKESVKHDYACPNCGINLTKKTSTTIYYTYYDALTGKVVKRIKEQPVQIKYTYQGNSYVKKPDSYDLRVLDKIDATSIQLNFLDVEITGGDEIARVLNAGISKTSQLFYRRTLIYLNELLKYAKNKDGYDYEFLFSITSIIQRASKLFRWSKNHAGPLMGTYYLASLILEVNPRKLLLNKRNIPKTLVSFGVDNESVNQVASATKLNTLDNCSIDYIFTDPPFGANLMYSELNLIYESIISVITADEMEAIESRSQNKSLYTYQTLMQKSFAEYYRILKAGKWMTVEFSNTGAAVWNGIQTALSNAGFIVANVSSLDKKQGSFKAVTTPTAVKQDLVISCYKPSSEFNNKFEKIKNTDLGVWKFVDEHLHKLPVHLITGTSTMAIIERSPKILYDRLIAYYVQRSLPVPIDSGKFQQGLNEHFIERDGMFFSNEQVSEYDSKKAEVPEFSQLSLFVANEQDSIYWLRNILKKGSKKDQDIQPMWMKEVAGNMRKGDALPEMRTILEENFLKDYDGSWYVPDPENEMDLERMRTKRLLKQFEIYKQEAENKKTKKIKEARVESLRAGFKQCYQNKDFNTIVLIGDKIPNNLLMEDEVLLQFYDIAIGRV